MSPLHHCSPFTQVEEATWEQLCKSTDLRTNLQVENHSAAEQPPVSQKCWLPRKEIRTGFGPEWVANKTVVHAKVVKIKERASRLPDKLCSQWGFFELKLKVWWCFQHCYLCHSVAYLLLSRWLQWFLCIISTESGPLLSTSGLREGFPTRTIPKYTLSSVPTKQWRDAVGLFASAVLGMTGRYTQPAWAVCRARAPQSRAPLELPNTKWNEIKWN